ncbi:MAG: glycosyltransferase family 2 protein [Nitrososphaerota archaeon]|uniref:glycosyltransferase family 2 protein n=1 Tax=Candidatus Bathycorpusculum sp. TaxID=2994959 RepID=UPI002816DC58|nr:glycosyltransferase family 2 protein [Candidatus Termitimicrobium sp.]MCL2432451.1 glycosyltransferase family 2 protein [Candidatus Termitimicrobium sp.]MDR0493891.1 glycosyltransferase family 2 protein [Nitrososphaerota archaeon]
MTAGSVDVVLLTKNSQRILTKCVESIYANVPVAHLIVVDGGSTDQTLSLLNEFQKKYHNLKLIFDNGTRATARQKGIEHVTTDWFMFVDSDVVLCRDWYKKAQKNLQPDVGAVWGIEVWSTINDPKILRLFLIITRKIFEVRGGTHDTLIRTHAVKDIKIPSNLHMFEDAYIKDWISHKGHRVVACYSPFCLHYRPTSVWTLRGSLGLIAEAFEFGNFRLISQLFLAYGFYTLYSVYQLLSR